MMMSEMQKKIYLRLGFVPNEERAGNYLGDTLGSVLLCLEKQHDIISEHPSRLLQSIIHKTYKSYPNRDLTIPLSGGLDSRALLAEALSVYDASRITCVTYGDEGSKDLCVARKSARFLGVKHKVIPLSDISWDVGFLKKEAKAHKKTNNTLPSVRALAYYTSIANASPHDNVIMSGYLGDVVTGGHILDAEVRGENDDSIVRAFCNFNTCFRFNEIDISSVRSIFCRFLKTNHAAYNAMTGLTKSDVLDLGFRQALRIRSNCVSGMSLGKDVALPYEDSRWIAYWYSQELKDRIGKRKYKSWLVKKHSKLFSDFSFSMRARNKVRRALFREKTDCRLMECFFDGSGKFGLYERMTQYFDDRLSSELMVGKKSLTFFQENPTVANELSLDGVVSVAFYDFIDGIE